MQMKIERPRAVSAAPRTKIETASFPDAEYTDADFIATTLNRQIALIRSRFGTTDHLAAQVAALAFGGGAA